MRYHGHQFGQYNPELGDGRGFLFAQFYERDTGRLVDLGTKGSGKTPYSRTADGRLTLKGAVREILATEMLHARAVPTSHTLSVIETGEALIRHDEPSPARSAVLVRLLHSHIRIGSFQRLAFLGEADQLEQLTPLLSLIIMTRLIRNSRLMRWCLNLSHPFRATWQRWLQAGWRQALCMGF